jgi:hypothetical protein
VTPEEKQRFDRYFLKGFDTAVNSLKETKDVLISSAEEPYILAVRETIESIIEAFEHSRVRLVEAMRQSPIPPSPERER